MKYVVSSFILLFSFFLPYSASAQETNLRFLHYNLLRYGSDNAFCNVDCKDENLKVILAETQPDIFTVNEILDGGTQANIWTDRILRNCLNINEVNAWKKGEVITGTGEGITNAIFYNSSKVEIISMTRVPNTRGAVYKCYFKASELKTSKDTTWFYVAVLHLKAGSTDDDERERTREVSQLMTLLKSKLELKNVFVMGDLNLKGASEVAYQNLLSAENPKIILQDPINQPGEWNNSSRYARIHTQSPRSIREKDGGSDGGMDDRFDFILAGKDVMEKSSGIGYVTGSYRAVGNDGTVLNKSILEASGTSSALKNALYRMSDHLPVEAVFSFKGTLTGRISDLQSSLDLAVVENPVHEELRIRTSPSVSTDLNYQISSISGKIIQNGSFTAVSDNEFYSFPTENLTEGIYFIHLKDLSGKMAVLKFVKL